jgi:calcineurin-like phosphoesterase family protein
VFDANLSIDTMQGDVKIGTFFTSDTHFSHKNVIKYCNRPFSTIEEMNARLITNWNSKIGVGDTVYHLGDFSFGDLESAQNIFDQLNGNIHLIKGNHDQKSVHIRGWKSINDYLELKIGKQFIVLSHYAMRVWNRSHYGAWMLYGHSHGSLPDDPAALSIDVGVDCHSYTPVSMTDIDGIMKKKTWKPADHHRGDH